MRITDQKIDRTADVTKQMLSIGLAPAISLTNAVLELIKLPHPTKVLGAKVYTRTTAGTVAVNVRPCAATGLIVSGVLAIDAVPEKFKLITTTIVALFAGVVKTKAPATAIDFSAAHVIAASKFGAILIQMTGAGVVSSKVSAATQAFNSAAEALSALPSADANNLAIGYIAIANNAGTWTAGTDDMTDGSDVTTATFNNYASRALLTGAITPVAVTEVAGTIDTAHDDVDEDEYLAVIATTDGSGALVDGRLHLQYRARGYRGD